MRGAVLLYIICCLLGCSSISVKVVPADSSGEPLPDAEVFFEERLLGKGATRVSLRDGQAMKLLILHYPTHLPREVVVGEWSEQEVLASLESDLSFVETQAISEVGVQTNEYISFTFPGLTEVDADLLLRIEQLLSSAGFELVELDNRSGRIKTEWKLREYEMRSGERIVTRSRLNGIVENINPLRYRIQLQMERRGLGQEKFIVWDRVYAEDAQALRAIGELSQSPY